MQVTNATLEDAVSIAEVHVLSWQHAYAAQLPAEFLRSLSVERRAAMWSECIAKGVPELLVAKSAGQVCGFVAFGSSRDEEAPPKTAEVIAIYLSPSVWSKGVGRMLWLKALERMASEGYNRVTLWVIANNERAIRFYKKAGFREESSTLKEFSLGGQRVNEVRYARNTDA